MKKIIAIILSISLFGLVINASASNIAQINQSTGNIQKGLELINQKVQLEMTLDDKTTIELGLEGEVCRQISILEKELTELSDFTMTSSEMATFVESTETLDDNISFSEIIVPPVDAELNAPPCPDSTENMTYTWIREEISGVDVYSVIASPVHGADHPCNRVAYDDNLKPDLAGTINTIIKLMTEKTIDYINEVTGVSTITQWLPIKEFAELGFVGAGSYQLKDYEALMVTRTVHQFIYLLNENGDYVYYGSANCVHVDIEEIMRKFTSGELKTQVRNTHRLILSNNYYNWPSYCVGDNLTGTGVYRKYSFVKGVWVEVGANVVLSTSVICATLPVQIVIYDI